MIQANLPLLRKFVGVAANAFPVAARAYDALRPQLENTDFLVECQYWLENWQTILGLGLVTAYVGYSLDSGCKWLQRREHRTQP
jgi:hypothetical protein